MSTLPVARASIVLAFNADLEIVCKDDRVEFEINQSSLKIEKDGDDFYASFEAIISLIDVTDPSAQTIVQLYAEKIRLMIKYLEANRVYNAADDNVRIEKITTEDEETREKFYDILKDSIKFVLNIRVED
jgi:hypothetical protein